MRKNFVHPGALSCVPECIACGSVLTVFCGVCPSSGCSLSLGGVLCFICTSFCVHSGDCDLCLLLLSLLSESSSESCADDPLSLCLLFEGYRPLVVMSFVVFVVLAMFCAIQVVIWVQRSVCLWFSILPLCF